MVAQIQRYNRPLEEVWEQWIPAARLAVYPFDFTTYEDNERVLTSLTSLDRDAWAEAYSAAAHPYEEQARAAEAAGDSTAARDLYLHAYGLYRMARFPAPNSPGKKHAYVKSQEAFLKAARYFEIPVERVEMPFNGRPGEGSVTIGYLRRPPSETPLPIVVAWGGIDTFKEDRRTDPFLQAGMSAMTIDMPGVGDAPLAGSEDAERLWDAIFDWIARRPDLDASRVAIWGGSTGGYWAAKVAHTHRDRLAAAVDHGGCTHYAFTPEWIEKAQHGDYPYELAETLACAFGHQTFEQWVEYSPKLSLLDQGVLDQPCAPLLLVNGVNDSIFPIADMYLLLEHGDPNSARFYPTGHMGTTPQTLPTIVSWVAQTLATRGRRA